jgi:hypothetical protein
MMRPTNVKSGKEKEVRVISKRQLFILRADQLILR